MKRILAWFAAPGTKWCGLHGPYSDRYDSCPRCN